MKNVFNIFVVMILLALNSIVSAQTTEFGYQGNLRDGANPASGNYDFQFALFDAGTAGTQLGATINKNSVNVSQGVFAVSLDFGAQFPGAERYLEIRVRPTGAGTLTTLTPRQKLASTPYSAKSILSDNTTQLGGVAAAQYLQLNGNGSGLTNLNAGSIATGTLSNARIGQLPTANIADSAITALKIATGQVVKSINSINDSVTLAAGSNITITPSGNTLTIASTGGGGGGGILNQTTQQTGANFNIDGTGTANILTATTQFNIGSNRVLSSAGSNNLFAGFGAGIANTTGSSNSFFGPQAGESNTAGLQNSFFGRFAGAANSTGSNNSIFGKNAGLLNTAGNNNSFFGVDAGLSSTGSHNSFFGQFVGSSNTTGESNSFVGRSAGQSNTAGSENTFLGSSSGGTNTTGSNITLVGSNSNTGMVDLINATAIGSGAVVTTGNRVQLGRQSFDTVRIGTLAAATANSLCITNDNVLAACSSSIRYKANIRPLTRSLNLIQRLRPVTFDWNDRDEADFGLVAEEVAAIDPLLVTHNREGEIQGVKYSQLSVILIKAMQDQQAQLDEKSKSIIDHKSQVEDLQKQLKDQQKAFAALKILVCAQNQSAEICQAGIQK